jgi:predicted membrane protein
MYFCGVKLTIMDSLQHHSSWTGRIIFSLLVITAGTLLLLFNAGVLADTYKPIVFSWPMLLVAIGVIFVFSQYKRVPGVILTVLGMVLLLPKLQEAELLCVDSLPLVKGNGWALLVIVSGLILLCRAFSGNSIHRRQMERRRQWWRQHVAARHPAFTRRGEEAGLMDVNCLFGASKETVMSQDFRGGVINCVFGGTELDFMSAQLAEGVHVLEVNTVFGGATLYMPAHWHVEMKQNPVFGRFDDKRPRPTIEVNDNRKLIIRASSVFGGGEIKSK